MTYDCDDPVGGIHTPLGSVSDTLMAMVQINREAPTDHRGFSF